MEQMFNHSIINPNVDKCLPQMFPAIVISINQLFSGCVFSASSHLVGKTYWSTSVHQHGSCVCLCECVHVITCVFSSCVMESGVVDMQAKSLTFLALFLQYPNPLFKLRCPLQWSLGPLVSLNTTFTVLPNTNLAPLPSSPSLPSVPS